MVMVKAKKKRSASDIFFYIVIPGAAVLLVLIAYWLFPKPPVGCQNFNLEPIEQVASASGQLYSIFQVPDGKTAVLYRDGVFQVVGPGEKFINNQGIYVCESENAAIKAAATKNSELTKQNPQAP